MSQRYLAGFIQAGLFNPLAAPTGIPAYTYELRSWGKGATYGTLGLGNTTNYSSPKQVGDLTTWSKIAGGESHTLTIKTDGTLWAWGKNDFGQLGLGTSGLANYKSSPTQVGALTDWLNIAGGIYHTLATKTDGTLWAWGRNNNGQLGLGNITNYSSPKQVGALTTWSKIACGGIHTLAIKTDGTLWAWGDNGSGQFGLGDTLDRSSPVQVENATNWANIAAGNGHTLAIKTDGKLYAWGANQGTGQVGMQSSALNIFSVMQIGALTNWANIAGGGRFSLAIKTDGTLWSWGYNGYGQLGQGNITNRSSPVQVGALTSWLNVACGYEYTIASKTDGTLWAWGKNDVGQLGLSNTLATFSSPVQVGALTTWSKIAAGSEHTIALKY